MAKSDKKKGIVRKTRRKIPTQNAIDIFKLFKTVQQNIVERLNVNREVFSHPVVKGDASEDDWYQVLKSFLPEAYEISNGAFIIDGKGMASDWIDLVIHDRFYSPLFFTVGKTKCVPVESVHAVFEVKSEFSANTLAYAAAKAASVTSLTYTGSHGKSIVKGLLTTTSKYKRTTGPTVVKRLRQLDSSSQLDFICVLNEVSFTVNYEPRFSIQTSKREATLMFFLVKVLDMMLNNGPSLRLDLTSYGSVLDGPEIR
jgi:hypothetical protein